MSTNEFPYEIKNVTSLTQGKIQVFSFPLSAVQLRELGVISRLQEREGGVQRLLDMNRATDIAEAMRDTDNMWLEPFLVHMEPVGTFVYNEEDGIIRFKDGFQLSVDDGQHRLYGMKALTESEIENLHDLNITATMGLTMEDRLRLFLQQEKRKHLDRNLLLKGRHILGDWKNEVERKAYELVLALNSDPRSPIQGRVDLEERDRTRLAIYGGSMMISATGLNTVCRMVLRNKSLLFGIEPDKQQDIVIRYLKAAAESVWSRQWNKPEDFMISGSRGVTSLLRMFVVSKTFRIAMARDFSDFRLKNVLALGSSFNWEIQRNLRRNELEIVNDLDDCMSRQYTARLKRRERENRS